LAADDVLRQRLVLPEFNSPLIQPKERQPRHEAKQKESDEPCVQPGRSMAPTRYMNRVGIIRVGQIDGRPGRTSSRRSHFTAV
jgi:hypothetical protein